MPALGVYGLVVRYGDITAVDSVSFSAKAGEILALLGPNGAGKTSTVETLEGYRRPDAGRVEVMGRDPVHDKAAVASAMGVMLQRGGTYPALNPRQALRLFASYYADPDDPDALLETVGLTAVASTPVRRLSGGEAQRLSLALALVGRPRVAVLDEPTAGVDPQGRLVIRQVIAGLRDRGACVLLTTHDLNEAERLADRVVIISAGRVVAEGTPAELMRGGGERIRFGAPGGLAVDELGAAMGATVVEERPGEYRVDTAPTPAAVAALTSWLAERDMPLADLRAARHSLEDVFLQLTLETPDDDADAAEGGAGSGRRGRRRRAR